MKTVITGIVAAVILAAVAAFVLDTEVQQTVEDRYQTQGVRL